MSRSPRNRCLVCTLELEAGDGGEVHRRCARELFGADEPPAIDLSMDQIEEVARQEINQRAAVTGVQRKISLELVGDRREGPRLTFVGFRGGFVLKPPSAEYPEMPEIEHLTMRLASVAGIDTAAHGLVRMSSGELAYLSRRFDRVDGRKLAVEDMCQLTGKLTEDKYRSSMEKVGRAILRWTTDPLLDASRFFDLAVFCFVTGNADMHLKNFSLLTTRDGRIALAPAYDLLSTALLIPEDREEMALPLNGRKARLERTDFEALGRNLHLGDRVIEATFDRMAAARGAWEETLARGFLREETAAGYAELMTARMARLGLGAG